MPPAITCEGIAPSPAGAPDPAAGRLLVLAERLSRTVSVARALVAAGRTVDLAGFDDGVGLLCAKTLDLDQGESRAMVPALLELRAQLDRLGGAIAARQDRAAGQYAGLAALPASAAQRGH